MAWTPGLPADRDTKTARILAGYPPDLLGPKGGENSLQTIFWSETDADWQRAGLELLARAEIEDVPANFDGRILAQTVADWRTEYRELAIGREPPAVEHEALEAVAAGAARFLTVLERLIEHAREPRSRIRGSTFTIHWTPDRLDALRSELTALSVEANSAETKETMRRPHLPPTGRPKGGWTTLEAFYGYDLPKLYESVTGREFTRTKAHPDLGTQPSEGVRFACVVASEVLGDTVTDEAIVKTGGKFEKAAARGSQTPE